MCFSIKHLKFANIQFIFSLKFSQSKIPNFLHCALTIEPAGKVCCAEFKLLGIGLHIPLLNERTLYWFKYQKSIPAWHQQPENAAGGILARIDFLAPSGDSLSFYFEGQTDPKIFSLVWFWDQLKVLWMTDGNGICVLCLMWRCVSLNVRCRQSITISPGVSLSCHKYKILTLLLSPRLSWSVSSGMLTYHPLIQSEASIRPLDQSERVDLITTLVTRLLTASISTRDEIDTFPNW